MYVVDSTLPMPRTTKWRLEKGDDTENLDPNASSSIIDQTKHKESSILNIQSEESDKYLENELLRELERYVYKIILIIFAVQQL